MHELEQTALELYSNGANVTAIRRGSKAPAHRWKKWTTARQTREDVQSLPWEQAGAIGIVNGVNDFRTIDIDAVKDDAGTVTEPVPEEVALALLNILGLPKSYPWLIRSGSGGGWIIVIRCADPLPSELNGRKDPSVVVGRPSEGFTFSQIELRFCDSQTIVVGEHPQGPGYEWWSGAMPTSPPALVDVETVASAFQLVTVDERDSKRFDRPALEEATDSQSAVSADKNRKRAYGKAALDSASKRVAGAAAGTRNATLFAEACSMLELANGSLLAQVDVVERLTAAGRAAGLDDDEIATTIGSASRRVGNNARSTPASADSDNENQITYKILDKAPRRIVRPLVLLDDGYSYLATWVDVQVTCPEHVAKNGRRVPAETKYEQHLVILRNDRRSYGRGAGAPLEKLGVVIDLPAPPISDGLLSAQAFQRYVDGAQPDPATLFDRLSCLIDRYMSFDRSIGSQQAMCELIACYIISTYFLDAYDVAPYLYLTGGRGSGKTKLLNLITGLAYLGMVTTAGGSFASLRDLASYGATLGLDDAENLNDPRKIHPDKRTLLLAGNRRGTTIPLKTPKGTRDWETSTVPVFAPRLFSAISNPDPVLASRSIVLPLVRTADASKANIDPADRGQWPYERGSLVDDLWLLGLRYLPDMKQHVRAIGSEVALTGRNLEPWRAVLATARWLEGHGVDGVFARMNAIALRYQEERRALEMPDLQDMVIQAIVDLCANRANRANVLELTTCWSFTANEIAASVRRLVEQNDLLIDLAGQLTQRVGMRLRALRLTQPPRSGGRGRRYWVVTLLQLEQWARAYALELPGVLQRGPSAAAKVGTVGTVGTSEAPDAAIEVESSPTLLEGEL